MAAGRGQETPGSEIKDLISHHIASSESSSMPVLVPFAPKSFRGSTDELRWVPAHTVGCLPGEKH